MLTGSHLILTHSHGISLLLLTPVYVLSVQCSDHILTTAELRVAQCLNMGSSCRRIPGVEGPRLEDPHVCRLRDLWGFHRSRARQPRREDHPCWWHPLHRQETCTSTHTHTHKRAYTHIRTHSAHFGWSVIASTKLIPRMSLAEDEP